MVSEFDYFAKNLNYYKTQIRIDFIYLCDPKEGRWVRLDIVTRFPPFSGLGLGLVLDFNRGVWGGGSPPSARCCYTHTHLTQQQHSHSLQFNQFNFINCLIKNDHLIF